MNDVDARLRAVEAQYDALVREIANGRALQNAPLVVADVDLLALCRYDLAVRVARGIDQAVLIALGRRGLTLDEARPRLSRQVLGGLERILLDGQVMVEIGPLQFSWSDDGRRCEVSVPSKEMPL